MLSLFRLERKQKKYFKSISNSHISLSFLLVRNWNDKYVHTLPLFSRNQNPFSDQNGAKTLPDGAAHTYIGHIREYLPDISQGLDEAFPSLPHYYLLVTDIQTKIITTKQILMVRTSWKTLP